MELFVNENKKLNASSLFDVMLVYRETCIKW